MMSLRHKPVEGGLLGQASAPYNMERSRTKSVKISQTDVYIYALAVSVLLRAGWNFVMWAKDSRVMPSLSLSTAKTAAIFALKTCAFTAGLALVGRVVLWIEDEIHKSKTDTAKKIKHGISAFVVCAVTYTFALPAICAVVAISANIVATQSKTQRASQDRFDNSSPPLPKSRLGGRGDSSSSSSAAAAAAGTVLGQTDDVNGGFGGDRLLHPTEDADDDYDGGHDDHKVSSNPLGGSSSSGAAGAAHGDGDNDEDE